MTTYYIVRDSDGHYAQTVRGTREEASEAARNYQPNPWTARGLAYVVEGEDDYPATISARKMYGDRYADYIQRSTAALLARGIDRRSESLGALLVGNDGD